ncbi:MAG: universal stress protein [Nitrospirota bacterium]|jgi:nucleotide-binding universal stress UspA family protein
MPDVLFPKILVPVDFSPCSEEAFRVALSLARLYQSEVLLLHVTDTKSLQALNALGLALPSEERAQKRRLSHHARLHARRLLRSDAAKGVPVRRLLAEGTPFVEIARAARAEKVSLVVMGSYGGQTGNVEKIFFGSTAEKVVRTAGCPVLCVPLPARMAPPRGTAKKP